MVSATQSGRAHSHDHQKSSADMTEVDATTAAPFDIDDVVPMSNVAPGDLTSDELTRASDAAEQRLQQGFDAAGNVGGAFSAATPPPGKIFGGYKKGMTGVTWHDLTPPVPHDYVPANSPHCAMLSGRVHCARGPKRCEACRAFAEAKQWLLFAADNERNGDEARPVMSFMVDGGKSMQCPFNVIGSFVDEASARAFVSAHMDRVQLVERAAGGAGEGGAVDVTALTIHDEIERIAFDIALEEPLVAAAAPTAAAKDAAFRNAEGLAQWLFAFWTASQQRKHPDVVFELVGRSIVRVKADKASATKEMSPSNDATEETWRKAITSALKKVDVEDLGDMDAQALLDAIPEQDSNGRGMQDLRKTEKELSVKVVFCAAPCRHVMLVGAKAKLTKKCFVLRNLLSHYHWRLSGRDVAFETMTASK